LDCWRQARAPVAVVSVRVVALRRIVRWAVALFVETGRSKSN
jgi:hypothetical protein